jgi:hypothetical protein
MKIKCTSKRKLKRILKQMLSYVLQDLADLEIYASEYYKCGIKTYKGLDIHFVNKVWFPKQPHQIYIAQKGSFYLNENELKFKDATL